MRRSDEVSPSVVRRLRKLRKIASDWLSSKREGPIKYGSFDIKFI